jgi:primosomal protein N'
MTQDTDPEDTDDEWKPSCYDCEREFSSSSALVSHPVMFHHDDGGYDMVDVPMCPACRKERMHTHECPECGEEYLDIEGAVMCCPDYEAMQP